MKIQIRRRIYETNSSSIHAISIIKKDKDIKYPETLIVDQGEFGWENEIYDKTYNKAAYIFESIIKGFDSDEHEKYLNKFKQILINNNIEPDIIYNNKKIKHYHNGYEHIVYTDENEQEEDGYLDHAYEAQDIIKDILNDETKLLNFLFSDKSYVATGNDNSDNTLKLPDYGDSWEYTKGN